MLFLMVHSGAQMLFLRYILELRSSDALSDGTFWSSDALSDSTFWSSDALSDGTFWSSDALSDRTFFSFVSLLRW